MAEGAPSAIKAAQGGHLLEFRVDQPQRAADILKQQIDRWRVSLFGDRLHVIVDEDAAAGEKRHHRSGCARQAWQCATHEENYSLEDVFIAVVEKARQQGKLASED